MTPPPGRTVCVCVCEQTHTAVCLVQWPEWQLWGWSWSVGVEPFVVLTDGAGADSGLLQATKKKKNWGVGMNEEPRQKQNNKYKFKKKTQIKEHYL